MTPSSFSNIFSSTKHRLGPSFDDIDDDFKLDMGVNVGMVPFWLWSLINPGLLAFVSAIGEGEKMLDRFR